MKEIIVTGATGFVGRNLVPHLEELGYTVTALSLREAGWKGHMNRQALAIIHLAGLAHDTKATKGAEEYDRVNTDLTKQVFDFFLDSSIQRFVYMSSIKAVSDIPGDLVLNEDTVPDPKTPYGLSKLNAEKYILSNDEPARKVYVLRPAMIHGLGNKGNLALLDRFVSTGIPYPLGAFVNKRSFLTVHNLNFIIEHLLADEMKSGVYNACDSGYLSTLEIIEIMSESKGRPNRSIKLSKTLVKALATLGDKLSLPFNSERLEKLTGDYMLSNDKLVNAIGKPLPLSAEEGMRMSVKNFEAN